MFSWTSNTNDLPGTEAPPSLKKHHQLAEPWYTHISRQNEGEDIMKRPSNLNKKQRRQ